MCKKGAVAARIRGRNVKKARRIEDMCAAAVGRWGRRGQPQEHLLRPLIEATIRGGADATVCRVCHSVELHYSADNAARLKPTGKCRGRQRAKVLRVSRHRRWCRRGAASNKS